MSSDVQFEEDPIGEINNQQFVIKAYENQRRSSPAVNFLLRSRIFSNEKRAMITIVVVAAVVLVLSVYFLYSAFQTPEVIELRVR